MVRQGTRSTAAIITSSPPVAPCLREGPHFYDNPDGANYALARSRVSKCLKGMGWKNSEPLEFKIYVAALVRRWFAKA